MEKSTILEMINEGNIDFLKNLVNVNDVVKLKYKEKFGKRIIVYEKSDSVLKLESCQLH